MIPKILHYTWFSEDPYPDKIKACIESWQKHMPDWKFVKWDINSISDIDSDFLNEALTMKKWAFAADFVRLWAIVHYGGVYLDTDVLVYKPFDDLLTNKAFIGRESSWHLNDRNAEVYLTAHCFGAEPHSTFFKRCLSYYIGRHFITSPDETLPLNLRCDITTAPYIYSELAKLYGYDSKAIADNEQHLDSCDMHIYPNTLFDFADHAGKSRPYCKHLAVGSWRTKKMYEPRYTISYKIWWRIESIIQKILRKFDYTLIKL